VIPQDEAPATARTVLLIIDDLPTRAFLATFLSSRACRILEAANSDEAAFLLTQQTGSIDLLVCDLVSKGGSGQVLADWIFEGRPAPEMIFLHDPWAYVPPRLRVAIPREQLLEAPVTQKKLEQFFAGRLGAPRAMGVSEKFNTTENRAPNPLARELLKH